MMILKMKNSKCNNHQYFHHYSHQLCHKKFKKKANLFQIIEKPIKNQKNLYQN